jgi:plastocyanin
MNDLATEDRVEEEQEAPRRHLPPSLYPVLALLFIGILVFAFSRILLVVAEIEEVDLGPVTLSGPDIASVAALFAALNILVGAALVAYGRRVRGLPATWPLLVTAAAVVVVGGFVAMGLGAEGEGEGPVGPQVVRLSANNLAFDTDRLDFSAGAEVRVQFDNREAQPHNFALYTDESGGEALFQGEIVTGPATVTYTFMAPPPGEYFFRCDVHPTEMTGTATMAEGPPGGGGAPGEGEPGGGGPGGGPIDLTASNLAFDTDTITVPAGGEVTIRFRNQENVPHNVSVYADQAATDPIFQGELVQAPGTVEYRFPAPDPGEYLFRCDVHPQQMTGTFVVQ